MPRKATGTGCDAGLPPLAEIDDRVDDGDEDEGGDVGGEDAGEAVDYVWRKIRPGPLETAEAGLQDQKSGKNKKDADADDAGGDAQPRSEDVGAVAKQDQVRCKRTQDVEKGNAVGT